MLQMVAGGFFGASPLIQVGQPQRLNWDDRTATGYFIQPEFTPSGFPTGYTVEHHLNGQLIEKRHAFDENEVARITGVHA